MQKLALIGDIGAVWPLIAARVAERLGVSLDFLSAPQDTDPGRAMREWISDSGHTPHLVVDAGVAGVDVPRQFVKDGKILSTKFIDLE